VTHHVLFYPSCGAQNKSVDTSHNVDAYRPRAAGTPPRSSEAVVLLVFDAVVGRLAAVVAAAAVLVFLFALWGGVPLAEGGSDAAVRGRKP
jgi:hypothetical protein